MSELKRYRSQFNTFAPSDDGNWAKASDAEAALTEKDKEIASLKKRFEEIKVVLSRGRDATGCSDEYYRGMYNGIEWCLCCIEEREANYKDVCEKSEEVQVLAKWEARDE